MTSNRGRLYIGLLCIFLVGSLCAADSAKTTSDLNVRIVGTASFQGKFTALIEDLNTSTDSFYKKDDSIYGYQITAISADGVNLEKNGKTSYLAFDTDAVAQRADKKDANSEIASIVAPESKSPTKAIQNFYTETASKSTTRWDLFTPEKERKEPALAGEANKDTKDIAGAVSGRFGMPLTAFKRVSSPFGYRKHPIGGGSKMHEGVDLAANHGTRILAADSGVIKFSGWRGGYGYCIIIDHQNGYKTLYGHCSKLIADVGDNVNRGDLIAEVGSTGASTGNHLHFEVQKDGTPINPGQFFSTF